MAEVDVGHRRAAARSMVSLPSGDRSSLLDTGARAGSLHAQLERSHSARAA